MRTAISAVFFIAVAALAADKKSASELIDLSRKRKMASLERLVSDWEAKGVTKLRDESRDA